MISTCGLWKYMNKPSEKPIQFEFCVWHTWNRCQIFKRSNHTHEYRLLWNKTKVSSYRKKYHYYNWVGSIPKIENKNTHEHTTNIIHICICLPVKIPIRFWIIHCSLSSFIFVSIYHLLWKLVVCVLFYFFFRFIKSLILSVSQNTWGKIVILSPFFVLVLFTRQNSISTLFVRVSMRLLMAPYFTPQKKPKVYVSHKNPFGFMFF